jgi:myo-inositol-1(or 4)-monophosphatase
MDYKKKCEEVCMLAKEVGQFLKNEINRVKATDIETKGLHDFVTYVDKSSERLIVSKLAEIMPVAGFITEEKTVISEEKEYNWIVDPLDGTTNFIHGVPCYSISIALMHQTKVVLGVVYEINLDECFYAWENSPAFLNGKEIKVSDKNKISDALLATGFPYYDYSGLENYMKLFTYFLKNSHGIRRLGSAAVDLAYVACGRFEGFYEYGLRSWDVAAGSFIIQRAGGKVYDFSGGDNYIFGKEIVSSNSTLSEELIGIVKSAFDK